MFLTQLRQIEEPLVLSEPRDGDCCVMGGGHMLSGRGNPRAMELIRLGYEAMRLELRAATEGVGG